MDRRHGGRQCAGPNSGAIDLGLFLDGVLPEDTAIQAEIHVATCGVCTARLRRLRDVKAALEDRTLWSAPAVKAPACLSAADALLQLEGLGSEEAERHLSTCVACAADLRAIEESAREHSAGRLDRPAPELVATLLRVGRPEPRATDSTDDVMAPIIVLGAAPERASKRLSPRPSRKTKPVRTLSARRPAAVGGGFAIAAAAAAAAIVAIIAIPSGPPVQPGSPVARATPAPPKETPRPVVRIEPTAPRVAPVKQPEPVEPAPDESEVPETVPGPQDQAPPPEPAPPPAESPTVARGEPAATPAPPTTPAATTVAPLDAPVADDGARLALDLSRVTGVSVRSGESWTTVSRRDGQLALKAGDRICGGSAGAFLSLEAGTYELCLGARTELVVRGAAGGPVLGLAEGRILCEVEKLPADKRLVVATNSGDFEVVGTVFSVAADARQATCAVEEGTVVCRGQAGEARSLPAGYALSIPRGAAPSQPRPDAGDEAWARGLRPERQTIYAARFDRGDLSGFTGVLSPENALRGAGRSLVFDAIEGNKFWGLAARAPKGRVKPFRAAPDVRLQLSFWLEKDSHVLVQLLNERQGKSFKRDLGTNPARRWITVTIPVFDLETYYDPGKNPVREGDLFSELEVYTGDPGDRWTALLDDVLVYKKSYR